MSTYTTRFFQPSCQPSSCAVRIERSDTGRIEWSPAMDALLGTDLDKKVGQQLGLSTAAVLRRRQALGIISVKEARGKAIRAIHEEARPKHFWSNISSPFMATAAINF